MSNGLYWVNGSSPGKLALAARPRGGDWLENDLSAWRRAGVEVLLSLLTPEEEETLDLSKEASTAKSVGLDFVSFPIPDMQVPSSPSSLVGVLEKISTDLSSGRNVLIHCRQGIGRSGLVAACLLISRGCDPSSAIDLLSAARGRPIPETDEQRRWIDRYAASLAGAK